MIARYCGAAHGSSRAVWPGRSIGTVCTQFTRYFFPACLGRLRTARSRAHRQERSRFVGWIPKQSGSLDAPLVDRSARQQPLIQNQAACGGCPLREWSASYPPGQGEKDRSAVFSTADTTLPVLAGEFAGWDWAEKNPPLVPGG